jgi:hypothetical protein
LRSVAKNKACGDPQTPLFSPERAMTCLGIARAEKAATRTIYTTLQDGVSVPDVVSRDG